MSRGKCTGDEFFSRTETRSSARSRSGPRAAEARRSSRDRRSGRTRPAPGPDRQRPPGDHQRRPGDRPRLHQRQQDTGSSTARRSSQERRQQEPRPETAEGPPHGDRRPGPPAAAPGRDNRSRSAAGQDRHPGPAAPASSGPRRDQQDPRKAARLQDPAQDLTGNGQDLLRTPAPGPGDPPPPASSAGPGDQRQDQRQDQADEGRQDRQQQRETGEKDRKRGPDRDRGRVYREPGTPPGLHFFQDRAGNGPQDGSGGAAGPPPTESGPGRAPPASGRAGLLRRRNKGAPPQSGTETEEKLLSRSATSIQISISDLDFGFGG